MWLQQYWRRANAIKTGKKHILDPENSLGYEGSIDRQLSEADLAPEHMLETSSRAPSLAPLCS